MVDGDKPAHVWRGVVLLTLLGVGLYLAGTLGVAYLAGFRAVWHHARDVNFLWVLGALLGVMFSWLGYYLSFLGIRQIPEGPRLSPREQVAIIAVGFGSFFYKGGAVVDEYAMKRGGVPTRVARVRANALKSLEHAPIAVGTCVASIVLLAQAHTDPPPLDFVWPWAVCPAVGGVIAVTLAARYRERLRDKKGKLKQTFGVALDGIWLLREMALGGKSRGLPFLGMTLFWAFDIFALWAALEAFSAGISLAGTILGYAVGYVLTRRTAPLGGAGIVDLILPLCLWDCGATFAGAVAAVAAYRLFSLWLPLPIALAYLPAVRALADAPSSEGEPALA
jgi:uncharacterized membrane protein YbhN (UPF0104 family)